LSAAPFTQQVPTDKQGQVGDHFAVEAELNIDADAVPNGRSLLGKRRAAAAG